MLDKIAGHPVTVWIVGSSIVKNGFIEAREQPEKTRCNHLVAREGWFNSQKTEGPYQDINEIGEYFKLYSNPHSWE